MRYPKYNPDYDKLGADINDIKNNHLHHIERDMRDVKIEVFRFKYIVWGAVLIFILATDNFKELLRLL